MIQFYFDPFDSPNDSLGILVYMIQMLSGWSKLSIILLQGHRICINENETIGTCFLSCITEKLFQTALNQQFNII